MNGKDLYGDVVDAAGDKVVAPADGANTWLRASEVEERFGFDPRPYVDSEEPRLITKLTRVPGDDGAAHSKRVFLLEGSARGGVSVLDHPRARKGPRGA